ncbi:monoglyceride lipase-like isoform X1 [Oculina patagonica]
MESEVISEKGSVQSSKGLRLFSKCWKLKGASPRALIFVSHGVGEHCSRYEEFGHQLAKQGFLVVSHDHVGHGRSEGERVQISSFNIYAADVLKHIDEASANNGGLPIFLFGHSMASTVAILCAMERPHFFTGIVLSAPAILANPETATRCMIFLGKIVSRILPSFQVVGSENSSLLSRDPEQVIDKERTNEQTNERTNLLTANFNVKGKLGDLTCDLSLCAVYFFKVAALTNDPLAWKGGLKAQWAMAIHDAMEHIKENIPKIEWPFIVLHGDADQITMVEGSMMLEQKASSKDKTIKIYPGFYHKLLNEPKEDAALVMSDIISWINQRLPSPNTNIH